jgi:hypothetical protein
LWFSLLFGVFFLLLLVVHHARALRQFESVTGARATPRMG